MNMQKGGQDIFFIHFKKKSLPSAEVLCPPRQGPDKSSYKEALCWHIRGNEVVEGIDTADTA